MILGLFNWDSFCYYSGLHAKLFGARSRVYINSLPEVLKLHGLDLKKTHEVLEGGLLANDEMTFEPVKTLCIYETWIGRGTREESRIYSLWLLKFK